MMLSSNPKIIANVIDLLKQGNLQQDKPKELIEFNKTLKYLKQQIYFNETTAKAKRIIFVDGVAGSGKTMLALKLLYDYNSFKAKAKQQLPAAVYLNKNRLLYELLFDNNKLKLGALKQVKKDYIRSLSDYKYEYLASPKVPSENLIIIDEAQRFWDEKKLNSSASEAEIILKIANNIYRREKNVTIICLIDPRQAIHTGEEKVAKLWQKSINKRGINDWQIYAPFEYENIFTTDSVKFRDQLSLKSSLRGRFTQINDWIKALLRADSKQLREFLEQDDFEIKITRDFMRAKSFVKERFKQDNNFESGLLISSKAWNYDIKDFINQGKYFGSFMELEESKDWFKKDSLKFDKAASEFACRGLELDYPIVCFAGDYYLNEQGWRVDPRIKSYHQGKYDDFEEIIYNIYHTLLSRARLGMILYIPEIKKLDKTYDFLLASGMKEL